MKNTYVRIVILVVVILIAVGISYRLWRKAPFEFIVLDIGQGDALLVQSNTGETLLIDGGPDATVLSELKTALPRSDKTIETLVLTHPDSDHIAGLIPLLDYYTVNRVMVSGLKTTSTQSRVFAKKIREKNIPLISADMQSDFSLFAVGENNSREELSVDILYPFSPILFSHEDANNDSIVMKLTYNGHTILSTGDAEAPTEQQLLQHYTPKQLVSEVLKLGHHGSKTSSTPAFIEAVAPRIAVASMGKDNSYHHPSPSVVQEMRKRGIALYTTAQYGRITLSFGADGALTITCKITCSP